MAKPFAIVLGIVLTAVGVWGMMTGGHDHNLVLFGINAPHNVVHLASGLLALVTGLIGAGAARTFLRIFGAVYGLVAVLGFLNVGAAVHLLNLNMADNFLHLVLAGACLWASGQGVSASG